MSSLAAGTRLVKSIPLTKEIDHGFQLDACFVQQGSVLRKPNVLRSNCRITDLRRNEDASVGVSSPFAEGECIRGGITQDVIHFGDKLQVCTLAPFDEQHP